MGKPIEKWTLDDWEWFVRQELEKYTGNDYIVGQIESEGYTRTQAEAAVRRPEFIREYLEMDLLPEILSDGVASQSLKDAILRKHRGVLEELSASARRLKRKTPGPQTGMIRQAMELVRAKGVPVEQLTDDDWREIARKIYKGYPSKKNIENAKALYRRGKLLETRALRADP